MHLHRSNRAEALVDALADVVASPSPDPFAQECIVVQGAGMQRWLSLELATRLGVFAHARFPFPRHFLEEALTAALGEPAGTGSEWTPPSLAFSIAGLLPDCLDDPRFTAIRGYLDAGAGDERLLALARRIAETFDDYAVYRPEMVLAWERGEDGATKQWTGIDSAWQPALWRALVEARGGDHLARRVHRLTRALAETDVAPAGLPSRAAIFGISTLPPLFVSALVSLARHVALHLFVLSPSREYWGWIRSERELLRARGRARADAEPEPLDLDEGHPLLASLGRLGRDFQEVIEERVDYVEPHEDRYVEPASGESPSALRQLQSDILHLRHRGGPDASLAPIVLDPRDRSIAVHACHGPMREAEVLRDQLLDLFERDADLAPHDVVVMAPDVARYAPYVQAAFSSDGAGSATIPCRIADRGAAGAFEVVEAFERVLDVVSGRITANDGLDLLGLSCVRSRFGIDASDEPLLRAWVEDAGVRWAIDAEHRADEGQPASDENTWRFGLDRLFAGMAIEEGAGRLFGGVRPLEGIEGAASELLGRLAEFVDALASLRVRLRTPRSAADWADVLEHVLDTMIAVEGDTAHQRQLVLDGLHELAADAARGRYDAPVALGAVRDALAPRIARAPAPGGFLTGAVTICEMLPMRSIPFRVVCLLGMNDGEFPRIRRRSAFDLIGARRRIGDRSAREEDRHLFLEAVLSARDRLIVTYVGRDIRDNESRPPSVAVGELLDHLGRAFAPPEDDAEAGAAWAEDAPAWIRDRLVVEHPLKPWSPRYFPAESSDAGLFSYSAAWAQAAHGRARVGAEPRPFLAEPLPDEVGADAEVELDALIRYFRDPARCLVRDRLEFGLLAVEEIAPDREPLDLSGLEGFAAGEELLALALDGGDVGAAYERLRASGVLPLGVAGRCAHDEVVGEVGALARRVRAARGERAVEPVALSLDVGGTRLVGRLESLFENGRVTQRYAKLGRPAELEAWITHLALCVAAPERVRPESHVLGRADNDGTRHVVFGPVDDAASHLAYLLAVRRIGLTRPLPFFPRTSRRYVEDCRRGKGDRDEQATLNAYQYFRGEHRPGAEGLDPYVRQLFGDDDPLAPSFRPIGEDAEAYGFRALAQNVFGPLLDHREKLG